MTDIPAMATLSSRQIRAILKEREKQEKAQADAEKAAALAEFAEFGEPLVLRMIEKVEETDKDDSTWAGRSVRGVPFTVDGVEYTLSATLTNVARSAEKKAAGEQAAREFLAEQQQTVEA